MLIGTAGHIDHGKTTLVRALTGVDTDRLPEEKARGISIELGYAYVPLPNGEVLGIIDVPGHERFVRTMIAGACGVDFALLVVAADDGLMPQTREHLEILDLLGVRRGAVALTKIDRASTVRVQQVQSAIGSALASMPLAGAPIFAVNATTSADPGTERLRRFLQEATIQATAREAQEVAIASAPANRADQLFRLAVDRVFTLAGHGTVVTGTVFAGCVHVGDTVTVMPAGHAVRVRSLHAQGRPADSGRAGQRCALNLVPIKTRAIARGDWVADPRALHPTSRIDAHVRLLPRDGAELRSWSTVHVHAGTAHALAHAVPLDLERVPAGGLARVQLVLATPLCPVPGDHLILRDAQAARTIGGGVVLDPAAPARNRRTRERLSYLDALERMNAGEGLAPLLECAPSALTLNELARLTSVAPEQLALPACAVVIDATHERFVLHHATWAQLRARAIASLQAFHEERPDEPGPDVGRLRRMAAPSVPPVLWRKLIEQLLEDRALQRNGPWLHLPAHVASLSAADETLLQRLQPLLLAGHFDPPWVRELAAALGEAEERVRSVLRKAVTKGVVHQVVRDLFYGAACLRELSEIAARLTCEHGAIEAAAFRDAAGVGRKRAIQILEFFDEVGLTRRVRDGHVMRADSGWGATPAAPHALWKAHVPGGATGLQTQKGASDASW